jgi:hypothetical protein
VAVAAGEVAGGGGSITGFDPIVVLGAGSTVIHTGAERRIQLSPNT